MIHCDIAFVVVEADDGRRRFVVASIRIVVVVPIDSFGIMIVQCYVPKIIIRCWIVCHLYILQCVSVSVFIE